MDDFKIEESHANKYHELRRQLLEYMGYEEEFLITKAGLKKMNKDDLVQMILEQRNMIRKLIDDLDPIKQESHLNFLDDLYLNRNL